LIEFSFYLLSLLNLTEPSEHQKTLYMPLQQKKEYFLILASELPLIGPVILIQKIL